MSEPVVQPRRRAAISFIFVAVTLDMIALGITAPIVPGLIKSLVHGDAPLAARYVGWFAALFAVMQFIFSPIIGGLSDRFGRRPVLLASMFGLAADYGLMAWAPSVGWLFIGRVLSGITSATFATANAYVADVTPPEQRAARFGILSAAFGIGFIGGPAIGGLLGQIGPRLPFWAAGALCLANGFYGLFVVPESLAKENRAKFSFRLSNPLGAVAFYREHPALAPLAVVMFLYYLAHQVLQSTWVPYAAYRYGWGPGWMGASLMLVGIGTICVQVLLVSRAVARLGDRGALISGIAFGGLGFVLYGLAPTGWLFMAAIPVFSLMGLYGPGMQSLMSRHVSATEQGRLQGANVSISSIASIIGPVLFTEVFARSIRDWSGWAPVGLPFYMAGGFMALALGLSLAARRGDRARVQSVSAQP